MALSNLDKNNLTRLFQMININDNNSITQENINSIRSNYSTYSKLELIAKQIQLVKFSFCDMLIFQSPPAPRTVGSFLLD